MADRLSPLAGWPGIAGPRLRVTELPFRTQLNVRTPKTFEVPGALVLCLGPDEWLVTGSDVDLPALDASIVDVSAQRTTVLVEGEHARDLLAHGCPLDLDRLEVGGCAQSTLARAQVILVRVGEDAYHVLVRASFARYLASWLEDASVELRAGNPDAA